MEMTENDIFVHWKTAKRRKYEINVLAQLNGTTPMKIREIIVKMGKQAGEDVSEVEEMLSKEEQKKANKSAYMKEYWQKKKARREAVKEANEAEKAKEAPAPLEVVDPEDLPEEPDTEETETDNGENNELIKKALQYFSEDLAEAIYEQRLKIEEEKSKLRKMEDDLERCKRILGFGKEGEG